MVSKCMIVHLYTTICGKLRPQRRAELTKSPAWRRNVALTPPRGCVLGTGLRQKRKAGDGQPSVDTGNHVRRGGHAVVAGLAREHAEAIRAAGRRTLDLSTSARPRP